jgi:Mg2+ and Co2+ transporter CorA
VVFKKHQLAESSSSSPPLNQLRADNSLAQSISLLSKYYGRSLNSTAMHDDPLYALNEVFAFVNASEVQCLNMIARNLSEDAANTISIDPKASAELQSNLLHNREVLKRHIYRTSEVLTFLKNRHLLDWPKSPGGSKANLAVARLQQDFEYLLERGQSLQRHCEQEISMMMSNSNIAEARRGVEQGSRVFKLTVLASVYIPLSFSCALFSMTFIQFENWMRGFYVWILVTIPIFIISTLVITWSEEKARAVWQRFCDNLKTILP